MNTTMFTTSSSPVVYTFTAKPKFNSQETSTNDMDIKSTKKWRPWYFGGNEHVQHDEKFLLPLYHGL
uniref:Ovule protein n=1 Tax=Acrobeloides nanus TaxID=290746 RepID=A0A914CPU6_9BILA